jgi:hypothetical protein
MISGHFVNGPYALITIAASADLDTHKSLKGGTDMPGFIFFSKLSKLFHHWG